MIDRIVTFGEVSTDDRVLNVERAMDVAVENIEHAALVAVNASRGTLLGWNQLLVVGASNHMSSKDDFLQPVKVGFEETYGAGLADADASKLLLQEARETMTPALVGDSTLECQVECGKIVVLGGNLVVAKVAT